MKILIFGDSITWGSADEFGGWAQRLKSYTDNKSLEDNTYYAPIYVLGISGDTSQGLTERLEFETKRRISPDDKPITIILAIGTNDSQIETKSKRNIISPEQFRANFEKILSATQILGDNTIIVGLPPIDEKKLSPIPWNTNFAYAEEEIKKYNNILKTIAAEKNISFINILEPMQKENLDDILLDGLHPNTKGHELMYNIIFYYLQQKGFL